MSRYWQTVRHLRPGQVFGRVWFKLYQPAARRGPAPGRRRAVRRWRPVGWRDPRLVGPTTVLALNARASVATAADWNDDTRGKLWLYNVHYFDDLSARGHEERRSWHEALMERWITENRAGAGAGWEPYPTSLRIANWSFWMLALPSASRLESRLLDSLATQIRWLSKRMETHLRANHLWANAKALVVGGMFFEGAEADEWRARGLACLGIELDEQVLNDGGHFERSPMYHAIVLEDVLDLVQLNDVFPGVLPAAFVTRLRSAATRMLRWLLVMSHPDGQISFFNDAAFGVAATWRVLAQYAESLGIAVDHAPPAAIETLPDSGYIRLQTERAVVLCDLAPIGPDYQPAHAHADTLSFELSIDGRRVIVNGGTSTYAAGAERTRQRGTAAHSTVEVDRANSSDVWGGFRVARRARPFDVSSGRSGERVWAQGAHDGYRHRPGRVIHRREWILESQRLTVIDRVEGQYAQAVARFILHPDAGDVVKFECEPAGTIARAPSLWHPEFGRSCPTFAIEIGFPGPQLTTHLRWS